VFPEKPAHLIDEPDAIPLGGLVGLDRHRDLVVDRSDRLVERVDLRDEWPERDAHAVGNDNRAVFVEPVAAQPTGTNRWPGRPAASQIAAASTASFLLRRT
jgi:hypothetical protein